MEIKKNKNGTLSFKEKIYLENGKTTSKTFKRKTDAICWKRSLELELAKNKALGICPLKDDMPFNDFCNLWLDRKIRPSRSEKTIADYESSLRKHILRLFGKYQVRSFQRSHAQDLIQDLAARGLAHKTINKTVALLSQILLFAESEGYVFKNPLRNLAKLKVPQGRIEYLSKQEVLQLLRSNATEEIYPLLVVALNTGMRVGELTGLCWDRVNFENEYIEVSRGLTRTGLKDVTKTYLIRYIPMNYEVKTVLVKLMRSQKNPKYVFAKTNGLPFNPDHFCARYFNKALLKADLRRIHFHDLRHTYASHFMMNDGNVYDLQKILGHTKVEMTQRYAHLSPQHLRKAVDTVRFSADINENVSPLSAPQASLRESLKLVNI